jgi:hypothetical protein
MYICSLEDVLNYTDTLHLNEDLIIKLYFPYLYKLNIHSKTQWLEEKENLLKENNKKLNPSFLSEVKNINMFYNIFELRKFDLPYESISIKSFKLSMYANNDIKIPLEIIFKILHSTQLNPFIKFGTFNVKGVLLSIFGIFGKSSTGKVFIIDSSYYIKSTIDIGIIIQCWIMN